MHGWLQTARLDVAESFRARWFWLYAAVFGGIVVFLFVFGLTDSRVMGFSGLSRNLLAYTQISMAIMPILVLITTVRSLAGDREAGVFEYLLSMPVGLGGWYWGKFLGRLSIVLAPAWLALLLGVLWGMARGSAVPVWEVVWYGLLLTSLAICFLGLGFLISSLARTVEIAQGAAFFIWLVLLLFLDLIFLGLMVKAQVNPDVVVTLALLNPLEVFRAGAMILYDPQLLLMGPASWLILDNFGRAGFMIYSVVYPFIVGLLLASVGFVLFRRGDLP